MSMQGSIASWVASRLTSEISQLRSARAISDPAEFEIVGRSVPSAGVMIMRGDATGDMTIPGQQYIAVEVAIFISSRVLAGGSNLDDANGAYAMFDLVYDAIGPTVNPTEDGESFDPLRYVGHSITAADSGLAITEMRFRTAQVI